MIETQEQKLARIKRELENVPPSPGVYLWKNAEGNVIYVGKAKNLRNRMRQYVNYQDDRAKIPLLVEQIDTFDYVVTENEYESLVLEKNYINQYSPYFNADFKDDKSYPFIAITSSDMFPSIKFTREKHKVGTKYFGPYTDSFAARKMIEAARRVVPLCSANCERYRKIMRDINKRTSSGIVYEYVPLDDKACFDYHVGLGPGVCCGAINREDYQQNVHRVERFLSGHHQEFLQDLQDEMKQAASELEFEKAARIKTRIDAINSLSERQHAVLSHCISADVVGLYREETLSCAYVFQIREGYVMNSCEFILNKGKDVPDDDLTRNFLMRYYDQTTSIPREVLLGVELEDKESIEAWLSETLASSHGAKVRIAVPQLGEKKQLLDMAVDNARHALTRYKIRNNYDDHRINDALLQLESALALDNPPMRIECFDISTIHGSYTVASMVVFTAGKKDASQYRRFKIKTPLDESNDFLCMQEVIARRYNPERMADERFGSKPDLIILDGGKPQLNAVLQMFEQMGIHDIALCGLAKRDEELFVPWQDEGPIVLPSGSASLYLVKQIRDEAHRFAITFHRQLRGKGMNASVLDAVSGLGPKRKKALLSHFKSFKQLRQATMEDIVASKTVPEETAREIVLVLEQYNMRISNLSEVSSESDSAFDSAYDLSIREDSSMDTKECDSCE